ncbi:MAG: 2-C-methyl-D-erythritol 4-phosphate cytidylyltransferase [Acidobacteria bacterium]|nr:2-C-methyl-D-erythritol 4-phosphate cytidylyltransferase [Acidobacteriota bacterium]
MKAAAIIPAAGLGTRMGKIPTEPASGRKQFLRLGDSSVLMHTIRQFVAAESISEILVAVRDDDRDSFAAELAAEAFGKPIRLASGGRQRQESVENCLALVGPDVELVAVHDAVRPLITPKLIDKAVQQAATDGAVILGVPAIDTVKRVDQRLVHATLPREMIMLAQTPQVFRTALLRRAFANANQDGFVGTDEASLVEHLGEDVHVMMGSPRNLKITRPQDLVLARFYLEHADELDRAEAADELRQ